MFKSLLRVGARRSLIAPVSGSYMPLASHTVSPAITFQRFKSEEVIDMPTKTFREKALRKKHKKKTNPLTGEPYSYYWRYPLLRFNKHYHQEFRNLIEADRIKELDERYELLRKIGKHPSPYTVELLVGLYSRLDRLDDCKKVMDTLRDDLNKTTRDTFRHLASGYIRRGNLQQVDAVFAELHKIYPDAPKYNSRVYGAYVAHFGSKQDNENLTEWMEQFKGESSLQYQDYTSFLKEIPLEFLRDREQDLFFPMLSAFGGDLVANEIIAFRYGSEGSIQDVENLINKMKEGDISPNSEIYDSLILACTKQGDLEKALKVITQMRESSMEICYESYCDVIRLCAQNDNHESVQIFLAEMQFSGREPAEPLTALELMKYYTRLGQVDNAMKYWLISRDHHVLVNPHECHETIALVANHDHRAALDMFTYLCDNHTIPPMETYDVLINEFKRQQLLKQVKVLEQHKFRTFN